MKEMIYTPEHKYELLHSEKKGDYNIAIVSYGTHPCAYISIPPTHPYYKKYYDNLNIWCHGGLTFAHPNNTMLEWAQELDEECSWIGWDYAHCDDYAGYYQKFPTSIFNGKKWTTQEILSECYEVIEQLDKVLKR